MPEKLIEGEDFYIEKASQVFTIVYLSKRGYCCKSACRHCPFGYKKPNQRIKIKS
jgi:hypothetical protein